MKDLPSSAQSAIEYGVVALLLVIIFAGSYKLYGKWTHKEALKTHQSGISAAAGKKLMEKPSKELCTYVMHQCRTRYSME
ncbi:MAG: hypothetical protein KHX03_09155 [Clostridium sp.]|nr:hypothetical protein [Clostridium sp.]